jgi:hypothetical protein
MKILRANRMLLLVAGAILGGYVIWAGHGGHALSYLPYAILLACPLMHVFMHGGHGHGHGTAPRPRASGIPKVATRRD